MARAQEYGMDFEKYKECLFENVIVIVKIEHVDASNNLEEILSVEGVDASIIGPYDLSGLIGYPGEFNRKEVKELLNQYIDVCKKLRKCPGLHSVPANIEQFNLRKDERYRFLGFSLDALFLSQCIENCFEEM